MTLIHQPRQALPLGVANYYYPTFLDDPKVVTRDFGKGMQECYEVIVSGEDYETCAYYSFHRGCNQKTGDYGGGFLNRDDPDDKRRTERTGLLGEVAEGSVMHVPVDMTYRRADDSDSIYDLPKMFLVDHKNQYKKLRCGLVTATNDEGRDVPVKSDIYTISYTEMEDREEMVARIIIAGFFTREDVLKKPKVPGCRANAKHMNREVPYHEFRSIIKLRTLLLPHAGRISLSRGSSRTA